MGLQALLCSNTELVIVSSLPLPRNKIHQYQNDYILLCVRQHTGDVRSCTRPFRVIHDFRSNRQSFTAPVTLPKSKSNGNTSSRNW